MGRARNVKARRGRAEAGHTLAFVSVNTFDTPDAAVMNRRLGAKLWCIGCVEFLMHWVTDIL